MPKYQVLDGRYQLTKRVHPGDVKRGIPELWQASSAGDIHYVRLWRRATTDDFALRALWNRETRSLMRLHGYPGAAQLFVRLYGLGITEQAYYAVLASGQYILLQEAIQSRYRYPWLQNLGEVSRRRPLWEGLLRIAEGLSVLHDEGTLHRSLNTSSIFVGPDGQGEFRLSGFEWSLRIAGREGGAAKVGRRNALRPKEFDTTEGEYSTASDWFDFGLVAAEIFGVTTLTLRKREQLRYAVGRLVHLREAERDLILGLVADEPEDRLSTADVITQKIRDIVRDLNLVIAGAGRPLVVAVRLGNDSNLSQAIEKASRRSAMSTDVRAQREWIENDLKGDIRILARDGAQPHFVVRGNQLSYRVKQWGLAGLHTWDLGYCENVENSPASLPDDQISGLGDRSIAIVLFPYARQNLKAIRDRSATWDKTFAFRRRLPKLDLGLRDTWDFFRITQQLDTVLTVAQICPVEILDVERTASETFIIVTPKDEIDRNELAQHLMLPPPSEQLKDLVRLGAETISVDDDDEPSRDRWSFLERRSISHDVRSVPIWRLVEAKPHRDGPRYTFRTEGAPPIKGPTAYLARNYGGTIRQLRRRHKAIEDLRSHEGLLRLITDPEGTSQKGGDPLPEARHPVKLDQSKLAALENIWRTQPSFAIQGPPGTGKTTLIQAFADRLFAEDPSAQILVTAHSHHTVDDVKSKIDGLFSGTSTADRPIMLRLGVDGDDPHSAEALTEAMISALNESEIAQVLPDVLRRRLSAVSEAGRGDETQNTDLRTAQVLVQDSANIVFSTSNDGDLADMAVRGRRFDWSIIEEAAKAHGFDMAVALQESHRLLLIGDHKQLPPFNAKKFKDLLGDLLRVRKAIQIGVQFAPGLVDPSIVDEEEGRAPLEERCNRWRRMINLFGVFFEASAAAQHGGQGPAATLTDQHRMHPDIAALVGNVFYPDGHGGTILTSPADTHERFAVAPPFELSASAEVSHHRLIWADVPYVQRTEYAEGETEGLFVSESEVKAVIKILEDLRPNGDQRCEIQILSPYNHQLAAIRSAVEDARAEGRLQHMFEEPFRLQDNKRMGATVDEFQGSEADIVIVSLVRNNGLAAHKSIGFLKEANRLNVLLSRARHKLIIVGSWEFFDSRCDDNTFDEAEHSYIGTMMEEMKRSEVAGRLFRLWRTS